MMSYILQSSTCVEHTMHSLHTFSHLHFLKLARLLVYGIYMLLMDQVLILFMSYFKNNGERMHYI